MQVASALVVLCCALSTAAVRPDSLIQSIVDSVSQDSIGATILRLQQFGTRECTTDSNYAAVLYARDRMIGYGCDTVYLYVVDTSGYYKPSVIGVKRGRLYPEIEYIVCGHIDSDGPTLDSAPGADDNASGTSVVLEACRVFADHWFNYTLRFACFNCEEHGLSGAAYYAWNARTRGDSILGVLNFDMVGYGMEGQDSVFVAGADSNPNCSDLLQDWVFAANAYTDLKYRPFLCDRDSFMGYDHSMFWYNGYRALLTEEVQLTPWRHGPGDTIGPYGYESCGVNNLPLCTEVAKACVATLALLAQVDGAPGIAETAPLPLLSSVPAPTLALEPPAGTTVFDAMGRRVVNPKPGVYFVRSASGVMRDASSVTKVVITR